MEQPKRKNIRLTTYDYSAPGAYFITVCTKNKENLFWSDVGAIPMVVNQLKGYVTKQVGFSLWQKGFYDHVIRSEADYLDCWQYIEGNPGKRDDR